MTGPAPGVSLPAWAQAGESRREHIARGVELLEVWARSLTVSPREAASWRDAGLWHDALRDAPEPVLRELTGERATLPELLHGPAAAVMLQRTGERRPDVLDAVRYHTIGYPEWARTGRALYMADFLEPGRVFTDGEREGLAARVPLDFERAFREVVRLRLEWALRNRAPLFEQTVALWNRVR